MEAGEGALVQRHTAGSRAELSLDPRATPGFPWALSEVCPGPRGSHSSPCPGRWKAGPKGTPRFLPVPSLSCLVLCPADRQVPPAELAPARVPHAPASRGPLSHVGWVVCGQKQLSARLRPSTRSQPALRSTRSTLCSLRQGPSPLRASLVTLCEMGVVCFVRGGELPLFSLLVLTGLTIRPTQDR